MLIAARLVSKVLVDFFFLDGVLRVDVDDGAAAATAGDGVIVGAAMEEGAAMEDDGVVVDDGVNTDARTGGRARGRDVDECGAKETVVFLRERKLSTPRDTFLRGDRAPFSGDACKMAGLLPSATTSAYDSRTALCGEAGAVGAADANATASLVGSGVGGGLVFIIKVGYD